MPNNSTTLNISIYKNRADAIDIVPNMVTMRSDRIISLPPFLDINQDIEPYCYHYWACVGDGKHIGFNSIEELAELLFNNSDLIHNAKKSIKQERSFFRGEPAHQPMQQF